MIVEHQEFRCDVPGLARVERRFAARLRVACAPEKVREAGTPAALIESVARDLSHPDARDQSHADQLALHRLSQMPAALAELLPPEARRVVAEFRRERARCALRCTTRRVREDTTTGRRFVVGTPRVVLRPARARARRSARRGVIARHSRAAPDDGDGGDGDPDADGVAFDAEHLPALIDVFRVLHAWQADADRGSQ